MKKHWVSFVAVLSGSILIEGDESPREASSYVKKHLSFSADAEGVDAEICDQDISIEHVHLDPEEERK